MFKLHSINFPIQNENIKVIGELPQKKSLEIAKKLHKNIIT